VRLRRSSRVNSARRSRARESLSLRAPANDSAPSCAPPGSTRPLRPAVRSQLLRARQRARPRLAQQVRRHARRRVARAPCCAYRPRGWLGQLAPSCPPRETRRQNGCAAAATDAWLAAARGAQVARAEERTGPVAQLPAHLPSHRCALPLAHCPPRRRSALRTAGKPPYSLLAGRRGARGGARWFRSFRALALAVGEHNAPQRAPLRPRAAWLTRRRACRPHVAARLVSRGARPLVSPPCGAAGCAGREARASG